MEPRRSSREHSLRSAARCCSRRAPSSCRRAQLADWILADRLPVRFQMQLHKVLWGNVPGKMSDRMTTRAVVLLSGGLDSATVLAMARAAGLECYALSVVVRPASPGRARRRGSASPHALGAREHRIDARRSRDTSAARRSPITSIDVPTEPAAGIPVTYVPARNTIMLSLALGVGRGARGRARSTSASTPSTTRVIRIAVPSSSPRSSSLAALATKAGVEGATLHVPRAADRSEQGADRARRRAARRRLRADRVLLPGGRGRPRLRPLRFLQVTARRLCFCRHSGPDALSAFSRPRRRKDRVDFAPFRAGR